MKAWFQNFMHNLLCAVGMGIVGLLFMGLGTWIDPLSPLPTPSTVRTTTSSPNARPYYGASVPASGIGAAAAYRQILAEAAADRAAASAPRYASAEAVQAWRARASEAGNAPAVSPLPGASKPSRPVLEAGAAESAREAPPREERRGIFNTMIHVLERTFPGRPDTVRGWIAKGLEWTGGILLFLGIFGLFASPWYPSRPKKT